MSPRKTEPTPSAFLRKQEEGAALTAEEANELGVLMSLAMVVGRSPEPEQMKRLGVLRRRAIAAKLKLTTMSCLRCKFRYVEVEGATKSGCPHCAKLSGRVL